MLENMNIPRCPLCAMPMESSNYYLRGMAIKCRHCNFSGMPIASGTLAYEKLARDEPVDYFEKEFGLQNVFSKLAFGSFFAFAILITAPELRNIAYISFAGFLVFAAFYGIVRFKNTA